MGSELRESWAKDPCRGKYLDPEDWQQESGDRDDQRKEGALAECGDSRRKPGQENRPRKPKEEEEYQESCGCFRVISISEA